MNSFQKIIFSFNTRSRVVLSVGATLLTYLFFRANSFFVQFQNTTALPIILDSLVVSFVTFLGSAWMIDFKFGRKQILNFLMLPVFFSFILTLFSRLSLISSLFSLKGGVFLLFLTLFFAIGLYTLLLNTNILNVASVMNIPLERAAKSVNYIFSIIILFLILTTILSLDIISYFKIVILAFSFFVLSTQSVNLIPKILPTKSFQLSIVLTILLTIILIATMIFDIQPQFPAILLTSIYYMIIGVIYEEGHKLTLLTVAEYSISLIILVILFMFFINFGIFRLSL